MDLLNWQLIDSFNLNNSGRDSRRETLVETLRAKVPGGWLVAVFKWDREARAAGAGAIDHDIAHSTGLTFVPDPGHQWNQKMF